MPFPHINLTLYTCTGRVSFNKATDVNKALRKNDNRSVRLVVKNFNIKINGILKKNSSINACTLKSLKYVGLMYMSPQT